MVATHSLKEELLSRGFNNLALWPRAVDTRLFRSRDKSFLKHPRPLFMYVGRIAIEKNIQAFLRLQLPGTKVVGDGPQLNKFRREYPEIVFTGAKVGEALASHFSAADVLVFPSHIDTFGLVIPEAMACGVPVAAYPVSDPKDIVINGKTGFLNKDLAAAAMAARSLNPNHCRSYAKQFSWSSNSQLFLDNLLPLSTIKESQKIN